MKICFFVFLEGIHSGTSTKVFYVENASRLLLGNPPFTRKLLRFAFKRAEKKLGKVLSRVACMPYFTLFFFSPPFLAPPTPTPEGLRRNKKTGDGGRQQCARKGSPPPYPPFAPQGGRRWWVPGWKVGGGGEGGRAGWRTVGRRRAVSFTQRES